MSTAMTFSRETPFERNRTELLGLFLDDMGLSGRDFVRYPWKDVDAVLGGMLPGEVHYVGAFSGNGKTLFMLSLAREWAIRAAHELRERPALDPVNPPVYYLGLETSPRALYTQVVCALAQVNAADVMTGRAHDQPDWLDISDRLVAASQQWYDLKAPLYLAPTPRITLAALRHCFDEAAAMGARVLMVDHVDHLGTGQGGDLYQESVAVNNALKDFAEQAKMIVIASTQFNNEAVRHSPLDRYLPPQEHYIKWGGHKREIATSMIGLYRPLRPDITKEQLQQARSRQIEARSLVEDWVMGVSCMKHRKDGAKDGTGKALLSTFGYRISDLPERDKYAVTGYNKHLTPIR